jgi:hypothetical protein
MRVEREPDPITLLCVHFMHFKQVELNNVITDTNFNLSEDQEKIV